MSIGIIIHANIRIWVDGFQVPFVGVVVSYCDKEIEIRYQHVILDSEGKLKDTYRHCFLKTSKIVAYEIEENTQCKTHH